MAKGLACSRELAINVLNTVGAKYKLYVSKPPKTCITKDFVRTANSKLNKNLRKKLTVDKWPRHLIGWNV